jgi:glycosyltransferase involved in cell wall biosynthesis
MRINWFSPVPPARTAIADVTARLIPVLSRKLEVTVWTDSAEAVPELPPGIRVRSCRDVESVWPEINFADFSIYHIGNDVRFHGHYAWMLERHPGMVVLHDFNLHELHRERFIHRPEGAALFRRYVLQTEGPEALEAVRAFERGACSFENSVKRAPLIRSVTRYATGIISFNPAMRKPLLELTGAPLLFCPLPLGPEASLPEPVDRSHLPGDGPLELVMFGYLNSPNRRLSEILEALTTFPDGAVRLSLFGHIEDREAFGKQVRSLGLGGKVRTLGYLSEAEMEATLKASHLALNLRNPTRGESSDALLKAWKYSLPVLVTQTGYYATLPEGTTCPVAPGNEVEGVREHIGAFLEKPRDYAAIGARGYRHLREHHTAERFADNLAAFLAESAPYRQRSFVFDFSRRLGTRMGRGFTAPAAVGHLHRRMAGELADWIA